MNIYTIKVKKGLKSDKIQEIESALKRLYDVKKVQVEPDTKEVRLIVDQLGCLNACLTIMQNMGLHSERPLKIA